MMNDKAVAFQTSEAVEQDSFESFFLKNYKRVYGVLYRLTGERMQAEDLTVETFLRYLNHPLEKSEYAEAWLFRVATRLGYNALRSAKRRSHYEGRAGLYIARTASNPEENLERDRERHRVRSVLRKMDQRSTAILLLHHSGCSYDEIAAAVKVSPASVGTLLIRAQKKFAHLYKTK
jgi:RNA polymerase sigma factor (sigma-70 family)